MALTHGCDAHNRPHQPDALRHPGMDVLTERRATLAQAVLRAPADSRRPGVSIFYQSITRRERGSVDGGVNAGAVL